MSTFADRLAVHTQCTTCGAPLDFSEGSNCVSCVYCRSNLLVTGRGQLLSYTVPPRLDAREAFTIARFAEPSGPKPFRVGRPRLFFLPYYRFRALELRWQQVEPRPRPIELREPQSSGDYQPAISIAQVLADLEPDPDTVEIRERHVEKNFLALDIPLTPLQSLGLRTTTLTLELFGRAALDTEGTIVAPTLSADAALARGEKLVDQHAVAVRRLLARFLSLVHFPFWLVELTRPGARGVAVIDGVSRTIVTRDERADWLDRLTPSTQIERTLGFRPLVCPNCGSALPLRPDDVAFLCSTCFHAWKVRGEELVDTPRRIVAAPPARFATRHFPFWTLRGSVNGDAPSDVVSPAFRCRRLRALADLATKLSGRPLPPTDGAEASRDAVGVYLDESDAAALALFAGAAETGDRFHDVKERTPATMDVAEAALVWLPFASEPYAYREPLTGTSLPKNLVL